MGSVVSESTNSSTVSLPIIKISNDPSTANELVAAAEKYGFLYIDTADSGFTADLVDSEFDLSKAFFSSPEDDKKAVLIDSSNKGWTGMHGEILDPKHQRRGDFKEALNIADLVDGRTPQQPIPKSLEPRLTEHAEFNAKCKELCNRILDLFALGLEIEEKDFFSSRHMEPSSTVRLLHYPALPVGSDYDPEVDIRAGAHSDYGSITLLFQRPSQPGLEIRTPDGSWAPVAVIPEGYQTSSTFPPILVNIGDLLSYWTNGLLKSTVHRVIFPKGANQREDRYSIAYFCHPSEGTELGAVPSRRVQERKMTEGEEVGYGGGAKKADEGRALTAKEHLTSRLEATYGFHGAKGQAQPIMGSA